MNSNNFFECFSIDLKTPDSFKKYIHILELFDVNDLMVLKYQMEKNEEFENLPVLEDLISRMLKKEYCNIFYN